MVSSGQRTMLRFITGKFPDHYDHTLCVSLSDTEVLVWQLVRYNILIIVEICSFQKSGLSAYSQIKLPTFRLLEKNTYSMRDVWAWPLLVKLQQVKVNATDNLTQVSCSFFLMPFHALTALPFVVAKFQQPITIIQIIQKQHNNKRTIWKKALKPELKRNMSNIFCYLRHIIARLTIRVELIDFIILALQLLIKGPWHFI